MKKTMLTLGAAAAAFAMAVPMTAVAADANRYAGDNRYETAINVAKAFGTADVVYLARGDQQVDAVAGGKLPGGPVLLVNENAAVQALVKSAISDLKASKVVVLGGEGAVSDQAAKAVSGDIKYQRLSGANRFGTAVAISKFLHAADGDGSKVYLANGMTLVDALVGGQMRDNGPILLTDGSGSLPQATADEIARIKPMEVVALGGDGAVSAAELTQAAKLGKGDEAAATAKAKADLVKAAREAQMAVKGWYTVEAGTDLDAFLTKCGDATKKDEVATTFPKVMAGDVKVECQADDSDAKVFAVDGATTGNFKEATDTALAAINAMTYKGLEKISAETNVDPKATKTEQLEAELAMEKAKDAVTAAAKALSDGPTKEAIAKYADKAMEKRIGGKNRFETAAAIAEAAYYPGGKNAKVVYGANGTAFADASVAGYLDNKDALRGPVVLVGAETLPGETTAYLKNVQDKTPSVDDFKGIGGKGVISDGVLIAADKLLD